MYINIHVVQLVAYYTQYCVLSLFTSYYHGAHSVSECTVLILVFSDSVDFLCTYVSSFLQPVI